MQTTTKRFKSGDLVIDIDCIQNGEKTIWHGDFIGYYPNGRKAIAGSYVRGKPHGKWIRWYKDGQLASVHHYLMGKLHGEYQQFFNNGDIAREGVFVRDMPNGETKIYFKGNTIQKRYNYDNGLLQLAEIRTKSGIKVIDSIAGTILAGDEDYRFKKVCTLKSNGELVCKTPAQIFEDLSAFLPPVIVNDLLSALDDFYDDFNLDTDKEILVGCGEEIFAVDAAANGGGIIGDTNAGTGDDDHENRAPMTQNEIDDILNACSNASWQDMGIDTGSADFNNQSDRFVETALARIDEAINNCQDDWYRPLVSSNPVGSWGWITRFFSGPGGEIATGAAGGILGEYGTRAIDAATADNDGFGKPINPGSPIEISYDPNGAMKKVYRTDGKIQKTEYIFADENGNRQVHTRLADGSWRISYYDEEGNLHHEEWYDAEGNKTKVVLHEELSFTETEKPKGESPPPRDDDLPDGDADLDQDQTDSVSPQGDQPVGGSPDCESLQTWWENIKWYCSEADWKTYECLQILRVFNFCVDPALVYPNPDGSATCAQRNNKSPEELEEERCKLKDMVMLPSGFGGKSCQSFDNISDLWEFDPCTDPRAMCPPHTLLPNEDSLATAENPEQISHLYKISDSGVISPHSLVAEAMENIVHLGDADFGAYIKDYRDPLIVIFGAENCPPCKRLLRNMNLVTDDIAVKVRTCYVEVAQNPGLATEFEIKYTPTIMVFQTGKILGQRRVGAATKDILIRYINRCLSFNSSPVKPKKRSKTAKAKNLVEITPTP